MKKNFLGSQRIPATFLTLFFLFLISFTSCGPKDQQQSSSGARKISSGTFQLDQSGNGNDSVETISFQDKKVVPVMKVSGKEYIEVEGLLTHEAFQKILNLSKEKRLAHLKQKLRAIKEKLNRQTPIIKVEFIPEVGYFSALASLDTLSSRRKFKDVRTFLKELFPEGTSEKDFVFSPILRTGIPNPFLRIPELPFLNPSEERSGGPQKDLVEETTALWESLKAHPDHSGMSGLSLMKVQEFVEKVETELNPAGLPSQERKIRIDGSSVKVGITDTGITYGHPAFRDDKGKIRISYMKDFTSEGRVYFNPKAKLAVRLPVEEDKLPADENASEVLILDAEFIAPTKGINKPTADDFSELSQKVLKVSPELKALLLTPDSGVKLGAMSETSFSNEAEPMDLNQNGKATDVFWILYVPNKEKESESESENLGRIYVDLTGELNFTQSKALQDFNQSQSILTIQAEKVGFSFEKEELEAKTPPGEKTKKTEMVVAISLVGFDPGNHGTHVAGIAAGNRLITNDAKDSKARGVAPAAQIYADRVCANNGGCLASKAIIDLSQQKVDIINMSLGGLSSDNDGYDPQALLVDRLSQLYSVQFMISAGNSGPGHQTIGSPSVSRLGLSIGAAATPAMMKQQLQFTALPPFKKEEETDHANKDFILYFSSRGPTAAGGFKPDLTAPGSQLSAVAFNIPPQGTEAGLASYWGTSMAAPAASGAYALLLDAARKYNKVHPKNPLPTERHVLRQVLLESARPFSVKTQGNTGDYTWIDQGLGMINLDRAWDILKLSRDADKYPSFVIPETTIGVNLDYEVKFSQEKNRNGLAYNGTGTAPKFARGVWIDYHSDRSLHTVSIRRNLPFDLMERSDAHELLRTLRDTSYDNFKIQIVTQGSEIPWLKITDHVIPCFENGEPSKEEIHVSSLGENSWSNVHLCVHRGILRTLPPGDHGVLVKGYRTRDGYTDPFPSFIIPVYMTVPHRIMAPIPPKAEAPALATVPAYEINGTVRSFEVKKHYVEIPKGVSMVRVTLEVPPHTVGENGNYQGCSGVNFAVYEGINTQQPPEFAGRGKASAKSCDEMGQATPDLRVLRFQRMNPTPGVWDLHVLGLFRYPLSSYRLKVEYTKLITGLAELKGGPEVLNGEIKIQIEETTHPLVADPSQAQFYLNAFSESSPHSVSTGESKIIPGTRTYGEDLSAVAFKIGKATGENVDLDLYVYECKQDHYDVSEVDCTKVGEGTTASFVEEVKITPKPNMFYFARVDGFATPEKGTEFEFSEVRYLKGEQKGELQFLANDGKVIHFSHSMKDEGLLKDPGFLSGKYTLLGEIMLKTEDNSLIATFPVTIQKVVTDSKMLGSTR